MPSPHDGSVQLKLQPAMFCLATPGSHASWSAPAVPSMKVSPQRAFLHARVQSPVLLLLMPLSHSSMPCLMPSPQVGIWQCVLHSELVPSLLLAPRSHCSVLPPVPRTTKLTLSLPSPHDEVEQSALHVAGVAPGSQISLAFL